MQTFPFHQQNTVSSSIHCVPSFSNIFRAATTVYMIMIMMSGIGIRSSKFHKADNWKYSTAMWGAVLRVVHQTNWNISFYYFCGLVYYIVDHVWYFILFVELRVTMRSSRLSSSSRCKHLRTLSRPSAHLKIYISWFLYCAKNYKHIILQLAISYVILWYCYTLHHIMNWWIQWWSFFFSCRMKSK